MRYYNVHLVNNLLNVSSVLPSPPQIVAGSYCTYAVKFDGTVMSVGEGSYGRLGHGGSENETKMRVISGLQGMCTYMCVCVRVCVCMCMHALVCFRIVHHW